MREWRSPDDKIILLEGDCKEELNQLGKKMASSVDVIVTSPPYNIGKRYGTHNDRMPKEDYLDWQEEIARELKWLLAEDGSFFLNLGSRSSDPGWPYEILGRYLRRGFQLQNTIIWVKSMAQNGQTVGHYQPLNTSFYLYSGFEYIYHLTKTGRVVLDRNAVGVPFTDKSNLKRGGRGKHGDVHDAGNVWFIPYQTVQRNSQDRPHPTTFPVDLPHRCLKLHGVTEDSWVLDPFCGLGTTALAAQKLGCSCTGIELDPQYWDYSVQLLKECYE